MSLKSLKVVMHTCACKIPGLGVATNPMALSRLHCLSWHGACRVIQQPELHFGPSNGSNACSALPHNAQVTSCKGKLKSRHSHSVVMLVSL